MDWITQEIAIGNCDDARRFDKLREAGIGGILSLTGWPNGANNVHGVDWRCVELIDGFGNPVTRLQEAICHLHELRGRGRVMEPVWRPALSANSTKSIPKNLKRETP